MPPPVVAALRLLGKSVLHVRDIDELGPRAPDPLIMQYAGQRGYVVMSRDLKQANEPWFKPTLLRSNVGYVFLRAAKANGIEPHAWELSKLIVKAWDDVERYASSHKMPFVALIKPNGRVVTYT